MHYSRWIIARGILSCLFGIVYMKSVPDLPEEHMDVVRILIADTLYNNFNGTFFLLFSFLIY